MRKQLIAACMALAAFVAFAVMPATASAINDPELTHPTGTLLGVNTSIKATNVGETTFTSSSFNVHCNSATMTGKLIKNSENAVEGTIETAHFTGTGAGADCTSGSGAMKVTPSPATNGLHWCLRSTENMTTDTFQIRGGGCADPQRPIRFALHSTSLGVECVYERTTAITGTYKTHPEDAVLTISEVEFPEIEKKFLCPDSGKLDMSFTLETNKETAEPLYIS